MLIDLRKTVAAIGCFLLLAGTGSYAQSPDTTSTIRVGASLDDYSTPLLYADRAGLFKKAGIRIEIVTLNGGDAVASAVAGGALEIGKSNTMALIAAHAKGIPFTIIAPSSNSASSSQQSAILTPLASPLHTARDFAGRTVGVVGLVSIQSLGMRAWINKNGGDAQAARFIEVRSAAVPALLEQGRIDAAPLFDPTLTQAMSTGKFRVVGYMYSAIAKLVEDSDYFTTDDWATKHPDLVTRFAQVMHDANVYVAAHENETIPLIASLSQIDPALLAKMHRPGRPAYVDPANIQPLVDLAAQYGVISSGFPAQQLISPLALKPTR